MSAHLRRNTSYNRNARASTPFGREPGVPAQFPIGFYIKARQNALPELLNE